jgi:hypothetical protein
MPTQAVDPTAAENTTKELINRPQPEHRAVGFRVTIEVATVATVIPCPRHTPSRVLAHSATVCCSLCAWILLVRN